MEQNNRDEIEIDLKQIFFVMIDKWAAILACAILFGVIAFAITKFTMEPVYQSTTKTLVVDNTEESEDVDANDFVTGNYLSKNYVEIVKSNSIFEEVIAALDLDLSIKQLSSKVDVEVLTDTQIIQITVQDSDPYQAQEIADAVRIASEKAFATKLKVPGIVIDEATLPENPIGPNLTKNVILGAVIGAILAIVVVVLKFVMDDTIKSPEDIERYLGLSTLASIPVMEEAEFDGEKKKKTNKPINVVKKPKREVVR